MVSTALGNECMVLIIQVKIAGQLLRCRFANIMAIPLLLFLSEVIDRHRLTITF
jgi:hypothetical protein